MAKNAEYNSELLFSGYGGYMDACFRRFAETAELSQVDRQQLTCSVARQRCHTTHPPPLQRRPCPLPLGHGRLVFLCSRSGTVEGRRMAAMLDDCVISENSSHRRSAATPSFEFPLMPCPQTFRSSLVPPRPPLLEHEERKYMGLIYCLEIKYESI